MAPRLDRVWHRIAWSVVAIGLAPVSVVAAFILHFVFVDSCIQGFNARDTSLAGLTFDFASYQCGFFGAVEYQAFSISRGPGLIDWFGKARILEYQGTANEPPVVSLVDQHTIRISVAGVEVMGFAMEKWQDLNIVYDIRRLDRKRYEFRPWTPPGADTVR
ncbi:hypothetical protein SAMN02745126_03282 [Enhydrobacter aerosaccus]|uniref:Uncharacterized protein n=1 Tax=Enhydrobacter aerosaccus TaxID=225324 RepID=A0A1T4QKJ2_9HYPH|nr:hypothetical protein [Enhydrobacter aerosaccus]SKA04232.1 hypothetical protein SAMN02745126_03282 [Enhydrobacter aerosaccus]